MFSSSSISCTEDNFTEKQRRILILIDECRALIDTLQRNHVSDKFPLSNFLSKSDEFYNSPKGLTSRGVLRSNDLVLLSINDMYSFEMDSVAISKILSSRLIDCLAYLDRLYSRVSDRKSKILVTGDVNSGKSTFVNAILREEMLPSDQQPCTQSFCEIVPIKSDKITVHAIPNIETYDENNTLSYENKTLSEMQEMVQDEDSLFQLYRIFKSFKSSENSESSLLEGDAVSFSIIDSPGLNSDMFKTMSLFSKQEDIDVIIFLINAANHLTLSAREFLSTASQEKAYVFIIINKFDEINNKDKCRRTILSQIKDVLPKTFEDRKELIHFISAKQFLERCTDSPCENRRENFIEVESQLKEFVIEKKTRSKLLPAQTYLLNLVHECTQIIKGNISTATNNLSLLEHELEILTPYYEELNAHDNLFQNDLASIVEKCSEVLYQSCFNSLRNFETDPLIQLIHWKGILDISNFLFDVQNLIIEQSEQHLASSCSLANEIIIDSYNLLNAEAAVHSKELFSKKETSLNYVPIKLKLEPYQIPKTPTLLDCIDFSVFNFKKISSLFGALSLGGMLYSPQPFISLGIQLFNLKRQSAKILTLSVFVGFSCFSIYFLLSDIENTIRSKLSKHYQSHYNLSIWTHEPSRTLQNQGTKFLEQRFSYLVGVFENALQKQKSIRAEKSMLKHQTEQYLLYLNSQNTACITLQNRINAIKL